MVAKSKQFIHHLFEAQVERTPEAVAVRLWAEHGLEELTYRELNRRANQVAHYLCSLGVGPETLVGVCLERSVELIVALFGVLKTGGAYLPLDPNYPQERLAFMLADGRAPVLISQAHLAAVLPDYAGRVIHLEADWFVTAQQPEQNPATRGTGENLAYVIYTSGSTGRAKGVMIQHKSLVNLTETTVAEYGLSPADRLLQFASISWDTSAEEIYACLAAGATLVLRTGSMLDSTAMFWQKCREWGLTVLNLPTAYWHELVAGLEAGEQAFAWPSSLRLVIIGGEKALPERVAAWQRQAGSTVRLVNTYGLSETTAVTTLGDLSEARQMEGARQVVPIGRPLANVEVYILDEALKPAPPGAVGELYIGGAGVGRGYLGRSELTAERFIPHPFSREPGARLYKSGDLARILADGQLEILGRRDNQVKVRGHRIELGEVEAVLREHPGVRDAVVTLRAARGSEQALVGYLTSKTELNLNALRDHLRGKLPEYMLPAALVLLEALPLTPNGKIDRRALPEPAAWRPELGAEYISPRNETEQGIAAIWQEALGLDQVGIKDNFFELGGHSLLAARVMARLGHQYRRELGMRLLFEKPTVAELAEAISQGQAHMEELTIPRVSRRETLPLSFGQERLWFLDRLISEREVYNIPVAVRLEGELNLERLEHAFSEVVRRHEALRTRFEVKNETPVQVIEPAWPVKIPLLDLSGLAPSKREVETQRVLREEGQTSFDLERGPLWRVKLLRLAEQEQIMLVVFHHIISDEWSLKVLFEEIGYFYEPARRGEAPSLPRLAIQYGDFAQWQQERLQADRLEREVEFWKEQLAGAPPVIELPVDRARPARPSYRGAVARIALDQPLTGKLRALSRREGVTMFMLLLAVFQTWLYRYSGQKDILVGTPIANRDRTGLEGLIGFFVNTLVIRGDLSGNPPFRELLKRVRSAALAAYSHQEAPFELLVKALQPERDLGRNPLFQVMFAYQPETALAGLKLPGVKVSPVEVSGETAMFDLVMYLEESEEGLVGTLEYSADLFDKETIQRLLGHFETLLRGITDQPEQRLLALPLLTEHERRRLVVEWNQTRRAYPQDQCIHQLFEAQVERSPEALAVVYGSGAQEERLNYRELNRRANQLARYLGKLGVGPETLVGICVERSVEMVVGLLGVLKVGGAYVPLDPGYPQERLDYMLRDAGISVLLTQAGLLARLPEVAASMEVVCLDHDWPWIDREIGENLGGEVIPDNLAYVIYTSGSTGRPKGVLIEHRGLGNLAEAQIQAFNIEPDSRVLQFASFSFDASISEVVMTLLAGATLYLETQEALLPGPNLARLLQERAITTVTLPPSALAVLPAEPFPAWQTVISAGEACPADIVERWAIDRRFLNAYGPSEATVCATIGECFVGSGKPSIGRPMANVEVYILDEGLNPVPVGIIGELYIGGVGVGRGYLGRPELTAEKFIPHPFSSTPGARLYRSGDLARTLPDGQIDFLGRKDDQVKVRGYRIELGEVEALLREHPEVREAVVVAREGRGGDKALVGYVVATTGLGVTELRGYLRHKAPEYMVPSVFVLLDTLPVTPNGKVDRRALPLPEQVRPEVEAAYTEPRNAVEARVAGVWAEVLGLDRVGIHDNFFELGGHSLLAVRVMSRISELNSWNPGVRLLFEKPTVAGLVEEIEAREGSTQPLPLHVVARAGAPPASFGQERLWFLDRLIPQMGVYNIPIALRLEGNLEVGALEKSLNEIIRRHEALRTRFELADEQLVQVIEPAQSLQLLVENAEGWSEETLQQLMRAEGQQAFELKRAPLRVRLLRLGEAEHILFVTMHHVISDEWSVKVFTDELARLYTAFTSGKSSPLAELPFQYADFAHWQRGWLRGAVLAEQLDYWRNQLKDSPPVLELPTDRARPTTPSYRGRTESLLLSEAVSQGVKRISQAAGVTPFMSLLAAFQTLLYRYSGQTDIVVGTPIANRNRLELEALIGFFVNTLVIRGDLSGNPRFSELLNRTREVTLGAYSHQELPFELLVQELQPARDLSRNPVFQVMFVYQGEKLLSGLEMAGLKLKQVEVAGETAMFDLTLFVEEREDGLRVALEYSQDLFEPETIQRMLRHYRQLLQEIVHNPQQHLLELPLLTAQERYQILIEWNETRTIYPEDHCFQELFEAQVEQTPEATAVRYGDEEQLSYLELNNQANQLAHYLRALGVGPEVLVGVCLERSVELVVGLLGVLKAGGAYVPLEPGYPAERLNYMVRDAGLKVLLTQERVMAELPQLELGVRVICLDRERVQIGRESEENLAHETRPDNLAYVIYTSGSTGKPKGVAVPQRGLVNYLSWCLRAYPIAAGQGAPVHSPIAFDLTITSLFAPLLAGRTVYLLPSELEINVLSEMLQKETNFSLVKLTPTHLELLSLQLPAEQAAGRTRSFIIGGENLLAEQIAFWQKFSPETVLINEYGPTETVVGCCVYEAPAGKLRSGSVPIGRPIQNMKLYILDEAFNPVPVGVVGELYIGGVGVARGYLGRPELTAERFLPNPFSREAGDRLYKSGDLARYFADGQIEFLGRRDDQVKVRGYRIELGEIEAALREHPAVREAVVTAQILQGKDTALVGFAIPRQESRPATKEILDSLKERLPEYMIPLTLIWLETLPLTPNGKVDRRALPAPEIWRPELAESFIAPRDDLETQLIHIWETLLAVRPIGVEDNFFKLGGHSLLAVRLLTQIEKKFGLRLPLVSLFQDASVEHLAKLIRHQTGPAAWPSLTSLQPQGDNPPFFCVHGITGDVLWFADLARHLAPDQPFYGIQARGLDGIQGPFAEIEAMAAYYIEEIRAIQPHGPYYLGGASYGGSVAFEMAQQFRAQGQEVALLAMFDNEPPNIESEIGPDQLRWKLSLAARFLKNLPYWFNDFWRHSPEQKLARLKRKLIVARKGLGARLSSANSQALPTEAEEIIDYAAELPEHRRRLIEVHYQAMNHYIPKTYQGRVTLFQAQGRPLFSLYFPEVGWQKLALGGVEVREIPGSHEGMFKEPHVRRLAQQLRSCIEETRVK